MWTVFRFTVSKFSTCPIPVFFSLVFGHRVLSLKVHWIHDPYVAIGLNSESLQISSNIYSRWNLKTRSSLVLRFMLGFKNWT